MAVAGLDEGFKPSGLAETVGDGHSSAERFHGEDVELDPVKIKRIVRKFDMRVLPCLVVMVSMVPAQVVRACLLSMQPSKGEGCTQMS